jgi:creatinine amidohydrolase
VSEVAQRLDDLTWTALAAKGFGELLVLPVGSTEQHGPHLPLGTDTLVAEALAEHLAAARDDILVARPLALGSSGEHQAFPGTVSIGSEVLARVLVEVVRSARTSFRGVVVVSGHGGNAAALATASTVAMREGDDLLCFSPVVPGGDAHAGMTETSLLLALAPVLVRQDEVVQGTTTPIAELSDNLRAGRLRDVSPTGVLGDPTGATAAHGHAVLAEVGRSLVAAVDARFPR